jgi:hypothetical protein
LVNGYLNPNVARGSRIDHSQRAVSPLVFAQSIESTKTKNPTFTGFLAFQSVSFQYNGTKKNKIGFRSTSGQLVDRWSADALQI